MQCAECHNQRAVTSEGLCRVCSIAGAVTAMEDAARPTLAPGAVDTWAPRDGADGPSTGGGPAPGPAMAPVGSWSPVRFQPIGGLATGVAALLALCIAADVFSLVAGVRLQGLLDDVPVAYGDRLDAAASQYDFTGVLQLLALIATAIVFIFWFYRARSNAEVFGEGLMRHSEGMAIGGWFIPLANLVIPKRIADDVWQAGTPPPRSGVWRASGTGLVTAWWATWIADLLISRMSARLYSGADEADELSSEIALMTAADVLDIAAAVLAIVYVRKLSTRQERTHALSGTGGPPPYRPPHWSV